MIKAKDIIKSLLIEGNIGPSPSEAGLPDPDEIATKDNFNTCLYLKTMAELMSKPRPAGEKRAALEQWFTELMENRDDHYVPDEYRFLGRIVAGYLDLKVDYDIFDI